MLFTSMSDILFVCWSAIDLRSISDFSFTLVFRSVHCLIYIIQFFRIVFCQPMIVFLYLCLSAIHFLFFWFVFETMFFFIVHWTFHLFWLVLSVIQLMNASFFIRIIEFIVYILKPVFLFRRFIILFSPCSVTFVLKI